jgi:hypothetical protein
VGGKAIRRNSLNGAEDLAQRLSRFAPHVTFRERKRLVPLAEWQFPPKNILDHRKYIF